MVIFEKYHPLLSAHYTLDWLTAAKLKDVHALRADAEQAAQSGRETDADMVATARYVNQAMRLVMANQALLYGIVERTTQAFVGSVCLWQFDAARTQAQLRLEVLPAADAAFAEVLPRVIGFAFFELGLAQLHMILPQNAPLSAWLTANHFVQAPYPHTRMLADGHKVPLVQWTLQAQAVADEPRYRF